MESLFSLNTNKISNIANIIDLKTTNKCMHNNLNYITYYYKKYIIFDYP